MAGLFSFSEADFRLFSEAGFLGVFSEDGELGCSVLGVCLPSDAEGSIFSGVVVVVVRRCDAEAEDSIFRGGSRDTVELLLRSVGDRLRGAESSGERSSLTLHSLRQTLYWTAPIFFTSPSPTSAGASFFLPLALGDADL